MAQLASGSIALSDFNIWGHLSVGTNVTSGATSVPDINHGTMYVTGNASEQAQLVLLSKNSNAALTVVNSSNNFVSIIASGTQHQIFTSNNNDIIFANQSGTMMTMGGGANNKFGFLKTRYNTLDDGNGNLTVVGGLAVQGSGISTISVGNGGGQIIIGSNGPTGVDGGYIEYSPPASGNVANQLNITSASSSTLDLFRVLANTIQLGYASGQVVKTNLNTLDDGHGNMTITGTFGMSNLSSLPSTVPSSGIEVRVNGRNWISNGTTWQTATDSPFVRSNILHPKYQTFTRGTTACSPLNGKQVPANVLRTSQGSQVLAPFIEEATTNLVKNGGFASVTGTAQVFYDNLTQYTGTSVTTTEGLWTVVGGNFNFNTSGATCGVNGSIMTGDASWIPFSGTNGTYLSVKAIATFTTPNPVLSGTTYGNGAVMLRIDGNNEYRAQLNGNALVLSRTVSGTWTQIASFSYTPTASAAYTIALSLGSSGSLIADLYNGTGTNGLSKIAELSANDTNLSGGFSIAVGGDAGVVITNTQVNAPVASNWTSYGVDGSGEGSIALTSTSISTYGLYITAPSQPSNSDIYMQSDQISVSASTTYALSGYINVQSITSPSTAGLRIIEWASGGSVVKDLGVVASLGAVTSGWQRVTYIWTTQSTTATITIRTQISGGPVTAIFDSIQLEQKTYATSYVENSGTTSATRNADSLVYNLPTPLTSGLFGTLVWKPQQASSVLPQKVLIDCSSTSDSSGGSIEVGFYQNSGTPSLYMKDLIGSVQNISLPASFNAGDNVYVAFLHDRTNSVNKLWSMVNSGTIASGSTTDTNALTISNVWVGCSYSQSSAYECNGTIEIIMHPLTNNETITDDMIRALFQSTSWGLQDYPVQKITHVENGGGFYTDGGATLTVDSNGKTWAVTAGSTSAAAFTANAGDGTALLIAGSSGTKSVTTYNNTLDDGSGNMFVNAPIQSFQGTTSGMVYWAQDMRGTVKRVIVFFYGYENNSGTAQTINFPVPFTYSPFEENQTTMSTVSYNGLGGIGWNTTGITIKPANTTQYTGYFILEGF